MHMHMHMHMAFVDDQTMQVPVSSSHARQNNTGSTWLVGRLAFDKKPRERQEAGGDAQANRCGWGGFWGWIDQL